MLNKVILAGRLTKDAELRSTQSGKSVASFTVATDNGYGENKQTAFINCVAFGKTAEFISNYFARGKMIILCGRLSTRTWEGQDGKRNYATEVIADEVYFGEAKKEKEEAEKETEDAFGAVPDADDDDLPF